MKKELFAEARAKYKNVGAGGSCKYDSFTNSLKYRLWIMSGDGQGDSYPELTYYF